jgi:hypothetical protein
VIDNSTPPTNVTDAAIQAEVAKIVGQIGADPATVYEVFLPPTSYASYGSANSCGGPNLQFCAYHSNFTASGVDVKYASMPYPSCNGCRWTGWTDAQNFDHFSSHETREAVTDPDGTAWFDHQGYEADDKCAWSPSPFLVNGFGYQYEWSNLQSGCVTSRCRGSSRHAGDVARRVDDRNSSRASSLGREKNLRAGHPRWHSSRRSQLASREGSPMAKRFGAPALMVLLVLASAGAGHALTFTCETVVLDRDSDPLLGVFGKRFESVRTNLQGDVVFGAHPKSGPRRLYFYPGGGGASVIAGAGDNAPGGSTFQRFRTPSINDAGDVGFVSDLDDGEGVYVRDGGGGIVKAAKDGDAAPGGDFFDQFLAASRINAGADVAFLAELDTGVRGVFLYDRTTTLVSAVARAGDATGDGREFCDFFEVGLGASGAVAFETIVKTSCANPLDPEVRGIWERTGLGFVAVAEENGPAPNAALYVNFLGTPDVNASDKVLFRAHTTSDQAILLFDPAGPTTTQLVATGDATPDVTPITDDGTLKSVAFGSLTDDDRAAVGVRVKGGEGAVPRTGIFMYGGAPDTVVLDRDTPPPPFSVFSRYTKIQTGGQKVHEEIGNDRSGTRVVFEANVHSGVPPRGRAGVFRCTGS